LSRSDRCARPALRRERGIAGGALL
jgi:hypothetical protein